MRKIISILLASFFMMSTANAEIKTYTGFGEYAMSDFETPEIAKQRAKQRAEQNAQEQAGVFIKSNTRVKNLQVQEEEIEVMTAGIMKVNSVLYDTKIDESGFIFTAKLSADIDTDEVDKWLEKNVAEKSELIEQNRILKDSVAAQEKQLAELKAKLAEAEKNNLINSSPQVREKISEEFLRSDNNFMSNRFFEEGNNYYARQDYHNAIISYGKAIELNPANVAAYVYRGSAFGSIKNYPSAEADYIKAIQLDGGNLHAHIGLSLVYYYVHDYRAAVSELNTVLRLDNNHGQAYYLRGLCFRNMNLIDYARNDFYYAQYFGYTK